MNGTDDLRTAIERAVVTGETGEEQVQFLGQVLADPLHRLAILEAMGLDVREGIMSLYYTPHGNYWEARPTRDGFADTGTQKAVLVVRPRGTAS